ncbi:MAG: hypothetical protein FK733_05725 [Asgard group archaeon]|nr:hypothetical protein [Asgard group archaeon]
MNYTIRDYKQGDIPRQLEVMKEVTRELYPVIPYDIDMHTVEMYEGIYSRPGWHSAPLKMLLDESKTIVGYAGYGSFFNDLRLFYPYILGEHRTDELMQRLFVAEMASVKEASKNYPSYRIYARSDTQLIQHNAFWDKQDILEKKVGHLVTISTEKLSQDISSRFSLTMLSEENLDSAAKFTKKCSTRDLPFFTKEELKERMELGNIKPNTHVLIEENDELRAFIGVRVGKRPGTDIAAAALNFHYLLPDENDLELLQTVIFSLSNIFKEYNVRNFGFEVLEDSPLKPILKDIGFEFIKGEGGIYHSFKL